MNDVYLLYGTRINHKLTFQLEQTNKLATRDYLSWVFLL